MTVSGVVQHVITPLFDTVLRDYQMNVPAAREPKVLSLLSISVVSLRVGIFSLLLREYEIFFTSIHLLLFRRRLLRRFRLSSTQSSLALWR